ncbi:MAG: histidine phosphatase family protein [Asgard group archaeon]|nr:histidine phosphatase family protein [Asgard group archaeon]
MVTLHLLRHAKTKPDYSIPTGQWGLSDEGWTQASQLAKQQHIIELTDLTTIWCSEEKKTKQTITLLAEPLGIIPIKNSNFNELNSHILPEKNRRKYLQRKKIHFYSS